MSGPGKWQVSQNGGTEPVWGRTGREIFFRAADGTLTAARYSAGASFDVEEWTPLFPTLGRFHADRWSVAYDVAPDDQRFLMLRERGARGDLVLVQNWLQEVLTRVGSGG